MRSVRQSRQSARPVPYEGPREEEKKSAVLRKKPFSAVSYIKLHK